MYGCIGWSSSFDWIFFIRKTTKSCSEWTKIWKADNQSWCSSGFNSWSIVFFFIYINDLSDNLKCNVKLFAGDTSMFSLVRDTINTSQKLNNDLVKLVFGPINEKYPSIQIHLNKIKTLFFHERKIKYTTHLFYLIILPFNKLHLRNI